MVSFADVLSNEPRRRAGSGSGALVAANTAVDRVAILPIYRAVQWLRDARRARPRWRSPAPRR